MGAEARGGVRVVLADDEAVVRAGVRAVLALDQGIEVVAEAADGRAAVEAVLAHRPAVVVLDVRMPRLDGLAAAEEVRRAAPGTGVVVLTTFGEEEYVSRALAVGADAFVLKSGDPRELSMAVHAAATGAAFLSPAVARRLVDAHRDGVLVRREDARERVGRLTPREREVLVLLAEGLSNAQIARRLHLVEGTVKGHVSALLETLGARNRVQAAVTAHDAGLLG
ncbi:response regulator transcription factor [Kineococcus glutinatus]|uniref:Response regulator transcription factor n=1 Tax=Kineococcus glutinatus TaxID=1070872 RepID=A0ABP9I5D4_9ACTN